MEKKNSFQVGDSVKVKKGVMYPDMEGFCIEGWQGRIKEIDEMEKEPTVVLIQWDSITLANIPDSVIERSEEEGFDYTEMSLWVTEIEPATARDTIGDIKQAVEAINKKHSWSFLGKEGKRIQNVIKGIEPDNIMAALHAWEKFLKKTLQFPFRAKVSEYQEKGSLSEGDEVTVHKIVMVDELYGVIVNINHRDGRCDFPLCDLKFYEKKSKNKEPVQDYCVWFANH